MQQVRQHHLQEQWWHRKNSVGRNGNRHRNHFPVILKPYTLPLKHYEWVQREKATLQWAGIIERSISPWASPVVIVPKKSTQGEQPRQRMCIDYKRLNKLQPEVTKADGRKGCISLMPLPKIALCVMVLTGCTPPPPPFFTKQHQAVAIVAT